MIEEIRPAIGLGLKLLCPKWDSCGKTVLALTFPIQREGKLVEWT